MSSIAFPLHLSVELFGNRRAPEAETRVKEAAVLYDRLYIEEGLLNVKLTPEGNTAMWLPPDDITEEILEDMRRPPREGASVQLSVAPQAGPDQPASSPATTLLSGEVKIDYVAQFHTVLQELAQFNPEWVRNYAVGSGVPVVPGAPEVGKAIKQLNFRDMSDQSLLPGLERFERDWTFKAFNRDMVLAAHLRASVSITPRFAPMIEHLGAKPKPAGRTALGVVVPNLGALPWEAIVEFREHPGSEEARGRLREFEEVALSQEPEDAYAFLDSVSQEVAKACTQAWSDLRTNLPEELAEEAAKTGIALIPFVGPFIEKGASLSEAIYKATAERRSWIAALMELKGHS